MNEQLTVVVVAAGALVVFALGILVVVTTPAGTRVMRSGGLVFPIIHTAEVIDLTAKTIACSCRGRDALGLRDGTRVDVEATFTEVTNVAREDVSGMVIDRVVIARVETTPAENVGPFR